MPFLETLQTIFGVAIWFLCPILILLILVQGGAGDLSSTFGGGGQLDSTLGVGASRKMGKLTGWLSVIFLTLVVVMAIPPGGSFAGAVSTAGATEGPDDDPRLEDPDAAPTPAPSEDVDGATPPAGEGDRVVPDDADVPDAGEEAPAAAVESDGDDAGDATQAGDEAPAAGGDAPTGEDTTADADDEPGLEIGVEPDGDQ